MPPAAGESQAAAPLHLDAAQQQQLLARAATLRFAVLGYGAQGRSHALNLRDSCVQVTVAQRPGSPRHDLALKDGFRAVSCAAATAQADVLLFALPDEAAPSTYRAEIEPALRPGQVLGFMHGFNIHYRQIVPPTHADVVMVAPKAQGRGVRDAFTRGGGVPALIAVHQDASGRARDTMLAWAVGIGCGRVGLLETTFALETETDLFGEQAVLCGGLPALVRAAFETLVEAGYPPELAYFECCHELKLIVDLIYEGGLAHMQSRISNTARWGALTSGPRIASPELRGRLHAILAEIRSGQFAEEWIEEAGRRKPVFNELSRRTADHPIEAAGRSVRKLAGIDPPGE